MSRWELFPRHRWPRGFGLREPYRSRPFIDGDQLELEQLVAPPVARAASALENLRAVLARSQLPQREFATWALGCSDYTLTRYLRGERIPHGRSVFLSRLESVTLHGDCVVIIVRAGAVRRLPRWRLVRRP